MSQKQPIEPGTLNYALSSPESLIALIPYQKLRDARIHGFEFTLHKALCTLRLTFNITTTDYKEDKNEKTVKKKDFSLFGGDDDEDIDFGIKGYQSPIFGSRFVIEDYVYQMALSDLSNN